jgi:outer membrane immunogenic protein
MKRLLIAGASLIALTCTAGAADLPPVEPAPVVMPFSWTGFYFGIHGGGAWGDAGHDSDYFDTDDFDAEGFVIGAHVGYLWQADWAVFGVEADGSFADLEDDFLFDDGVVLDPLDGSVDSSFLASFRGRLGVAFDRFLIYGTGGVAFTGLDLDIGTYSDDADFMGWVAGGGIEYAITDNVSLGVEYLHYDFGDEIFEDEGFDPIEADFNVDVIRGRLNVKFDSLFN